MSLYNVKKFDEAYQITKFTDDLDVESSYITSRSTCDCPAGVRDTCRHRQMLPEFLEAKYVDKSWFLDWDNHLWFYYDVQSGEMMTEPPKPDTRDLGWPRRRV